MNRIYDVSSMFVHVIEADRDRAEEVLATIEPMRSLADRLSAFGLDDRAVWTEGCNRLGYSLIWRFGDDEGHARLDWLLGVDRDGAGRTVLTARLAARGSDAAARRRVLRSWSLVEELAAGHARRLARTLEDYDVDDSALAAAATLRAVG